ncbi:hypothetical protein ABTG47_20120, partial [Acinetobacter baumannii]
PVGAVGRHRNGAARVTGHCEAIGAEGIAEEIDPDVGSSRKQYGIRAGVVNLVGHRVSSSSHV